MKFQIRDGFTVKLQTKIDLGDGKFEIQENNIFGGQKCDLNQEQADMHAHKLEPLDKQAEAYLAAKVLPQSESAALGLSPEALAMAKALATEMAKQIVAAVQAPAPDPAVTA